MENPAINTDKTIFRQPTTDYGPEDGNDSGMEPSVFVTKEGAVGFNHYGTCFVKPIKEWVEMAKYYSGNLHHGTQKEGTNDQQ